MTEAALTAGSFRVLEFWLYRHRRTLRALLFSSFVAPLLYLGSLGFGLGSLVDGAGTGALTGVAYVAFVAPGVLAATAMQTGVSESAYPVLGAQRWQQQYHAMRATRLTVGDILAGHVMFILFRLVVGVLAFTAIGALLGAFRSPWVLLALPVAVLVGLVHALLVMAYAVGAEGDTGLTMVFRFLVVPMFLFSGTFFPVDGLPGWLQPVAWVTPLWHGTELCRALALADVQLVPALGHLGYLLLWLPPGAVLAFRRYRSRLSR